MRIRNAGVAVANAVAVRLERQSLLSRRLPEAPRLDVIIDEGVLRRAIPDTLGMQKQLAHLVNVSTRRNVGSSSVMTPG